MEFTVDLTQIFDDGDSVQRSVNVYECVKIFEYKMLICNGSGIIAKISSHSHR